MENETIHYLLSESLSIILVVGACTPQRAIATARVAVGWCLRRFMASSLMSARDIIIDVRLVEAVSQYFSAICDKKSLREMGSLLHNC